MFRKIAALALFLALAPLIFAPSSQAMQLSSRGRSSNLRVDSVSKTMNASATTASVPLWRLTGTIRITKIYGVVTTTIGANHTAAHFRMTDGTNTPAITLATGVAVSAAGVGSVLLRNSDVGGALALNNSSQARVTSSAGATGQPFFTESVLTQKLSTNTDIEYRYTTTDAPTSGVIKFFIEWEPLSDDGNLTAL